MVKFPNVTLKRGSFKGDNEYFEWLKTINLNTVDRRTVTISLLDETGSPAITWKVKNAFPVKLQSTDLKAEGNEVAIETLEMMAAGYLAENPDYSGLICPMIDARRMEVFTRMYTVQLDPVSSIGAKILEPGSFAPELEQQPVYFFGDGAAKWQSICQHQHARFLTIDWNAAGMIEMAEKRFQQQAFTSLAYSAPDYGKEFYSTQL